VQRIDPLICHPRAATSIRHQHRPNHRWSRALLSKGGLEVDAIVVSPATIKLAPARTLYAVSVAVVWGIGSAIAAFDPPMLRHIPAPLLSNLASINMLEAGRMSLLCLQHVGLMLLCHL
jgi:hypothetical protein